MNKKLIKRLMSVVLVIGIFLAYWGIIGIFVSPGIQSFGAKSDFSQFSGNELERNAIVEYIYAGNTVTMDELVGYVSGEKASLNVTGINVSEMQAMIASKDDVVSQALAKNKNAVKADAEKRFDKAKGEFEDRFDALRKLDDDKYVNELIELIPEYNEKYSALKTQLDAVNEKLLPFDEQVKSLNSEKMTLQKAIRKLENSADSKPEEIDALRAQLEEFNAQYVEIDAEKAKVNEEIKAIQKKMSEEAETVLQASGYARLAVSRKAGSATLSDNMDYIAIHMSTLLIVLGAVMIVAGIAVKIAFKEKKVSGLPEEFINYSVSRQKIASASKKFDVQKMLAPVALIILFAFFCLASESFRSSYTMKTILENSYYIGFLAFGVTFVIMTGGIDLSIGTNMICSALIGCYVYSTLGVPLWIAIWLVPIIAMIFGLLNGIMVAKLKLPPFIATLGTQMITTGFGQIITKVTTQYYPTTGSANTWFKTATYRAGTFPIGVCYLIAAFLIAFFLLNRTKFGRYTFAIGSNEEAARLSGVNTDNWKIAVYAVCGLFVGFAGVMYAAVNTVIIPGYGAGQELNGIAAVVIGGTSMSGGSGSVVGTIIGVFIMSVLKSGLSSVGLQSHWQTFFTGFVVIGAVLLDQLRTASAQKVKTEKKRNSPKKVG